MSTGGRLLLVSVPSRQTSVRPLAPMTSTVSYSYLITSLPSHTLHLTRRKTGYLGPIDPNVAGCTTGSLRLRCPPRWDEVLSLYFSRVFPLEHTLTPVNKKARCSTVHCALRYREWLLRLPSIITSVPFARPWPLLRGPRPCFVRQGTRPTRSYCCCVATTN
jgi:hypothetical protein